MSNSKKKGEDITDMTKKIQNSTKKPYNLKQIIANCKSKIKSALCDTLLKQTNSTCNQYYNTSLCPTRNNANVKRNPDFCNSISLIDLCKTETFQNISNNNNDLLIILLFIILIILKIIYKDK